MNMNNPLENLRQLTEAVRMAGADIAPTYIEYVQLAFAIANDCGEAGRNDFLSLCSLSSKYDEKNAQALFSNALHADKEDIHLGTVFHLAGQCGVKISGSTGSHKAGTMGTAGTAPDFPHTCARYFTVLGASLSHIVRCQYGRKWQAPCMQTFIVAPSASGKSALTWVRLLIEPIHDKIRSEVKEAMKTYRREKAAYDSLGKERKNQEAPVLPPNRMFLISGNNTGTGILQNIMDSNGTGIICESEADTVSTAIGTEYGNWSDTLRKAFDHDRLSYNRRTDREYQEVSRSYLSVLLSGTPAQVKPLIPTAENGLFSRQNFYYMPRVTQWADQFGEDEVDVDEEFRLMGNEWKNTLDELTLRGLFTLKLTHAQHKQFNFLFDKLFHRSGKINGDEMSSSVIRLAVNACRMMSIVAILRSLEDPSLVKPDAHISSDNLKDRIIPRWNLVITDDDFHAVLALVDPLYLHATHVLSFLSSSVIKRRSTADKDMLFAEMEDEFTRRMLLEKAHDRRIPESTALTWLKRLTKQGALVSVDGKGTYHKN